MEVTRDVILDLLPLYLAGEASAGTRSLVTHFLARNPELADEVRAQQKSNARVAEVAVPPDLELKSLSRTRRLLALRQWTFGLAWFFTAIGLSMRGTLSGWNLRGFHPLVFDYPIQLGGALTVAALCWMAYFTVKRRTRTTL